MIAKIRIAGYRVFRRFQIQDLDAGLNVIVGDNQAGKSTLLEAVGLAMSGRIGGRWARDELNPHWFNADVVNEFFAALDAGQQVAPPQILIELYLDKANDDFQPLRGVYNSSRDKDAPGLKLEVRPDAEYAQELEDYLTDPNRPPILPVEYYEVVWRGFNNEVQTRRPRKLGFAMIDSRTIRNPAGIDFHTREMLADFVDAKEKAAIAVAHRTARHAITDTTLAAANERIRESGTALHDRALGLQMDQSAGASWETSVVPAVAQVPFGMAGQGQQAAIKVALAMNRRADETGLVLLEEPENHLSHTSLRKLIARIQALAGERQILVTTHSSFVLNRLGLDRLTLLHQGMAASFADLKPDTVRYFKRLSGYDSLRLVLAEKVVLVEGPSDEMIFVRAYSDKHGALPIEHGIDVISMQGVALARSLELAAALGRKIAALRDNDDKEPSHWEAKVLELLEDGSRELFIGSVETGSTLERQIGHVNSADLLRDVLALEADEDPVEWMLENKTEAALRIAVANTTIAYPNFVTRAIEFIE